MNVIQSIKNYGEAAPDLIAVFYHDIQLTYGNLSHIIAYNQNRLLSKGYKKGKKVFLLYNNQFGFILSFLSLLATGCWVVPVPDHLTDAEKNEFMNLVEADWFYEEDICTDVIAEDVSYNLYVPEDQETGILHFTSGSTGKAKLCVRTIKSLTEEGLAYINTFHIKSEDRMLSAPPLYHSFALGAEMITALLAGCSIVAVDQYTPRSILRTIDQYKVSVLFLVPAMVKNLTEVISQKDFDFTSLRIVLVGAGPVEREISDAFYSRFGVPLFSNYGSTESGGLISRLTKEPFASVGKPMAGVSVQIRDKDGKLCEQGQIGDVWVRCGGMMTGYYGGVQAPFDDQGFFPMGDMALCDKDGYIFLKGRKKNLIIIGGKKVNPYEVENVIKSLPQVEDCVVEARKTGGSECIAAMILCKKGFSLNESDIRSHCIKYLSSYKVPGVICFVTTIPRNQLGKIIRKNYERS